MLYKQLGKSFPAPPLQHCRATCPVLLPSHAHECLWPQHCSSALLWVQTHTLQGWQNHSVSSHSKWALSQPCLPLLPVVAHTVSATVLSTHTQMCDGHSVSCCVFTSTCSYAQTQFLKPAQTYTNMHTLLSLIHAQKHLLFTFSGTKERICRGTWTGWIIGWGQWYEVH